MQAPNWTDFNQCAVCCSKFDANEALPISLSCSHTLCVRCLGKLKARVCPYDKSAISPEAESLPPNTALLQLLGDKLVTPPDLSKLTLIESDLALYRNAVSAIEGLAMFLQPLAEQGLTVAIGYLTKPVLKKLVTVVNCQILEREGRARAMRAARSIADRTITELLVMHQNQQQIASLLWTAVRNRGCQFLGPVMQEAALKLIVKVLENGISLSRKNIVMFVVQQLQDEFSMASKTSVGHVVQLLYRASCFNVEKREEDSSLMQLKEEFRTYETLRREHDSQIIKMAMDTGLRISPEQWSTLLYGDHKHKSEMQSIIDKLISLGAASSGLSELIVAINRSQDPYKLSDEIIPHLETLLKVDVNIDKGSELVGLWKVFSDTMNALLATLHGFSMFMQIQSGRYRTGMCPHLAKPGGCPKGDHCTYAHSEEQRDHYRDLAKNSKTVKARTEPFPKIPPGVKLGRHSGDHGPPKVDGTYYTTAPGYDSYPTVPPGYAPTANAAVVAAGLGEQYATAGFQENVVLQSAIQVDPTLQVIQATPTHGGQIYTTPVRATVVPVAVAPTGHTHPHDWYKEQKLSGQATYIQTAGGESYLTKQNGHPPQQQQYSGYHSNAPLVTYPEKTISAPEGRQLDVESLKRAHENVRRTHEIITRSSAHAGGVASNYAPSQQAYAAQAAGRSYSQPSTSKYSYPSSTSYSDDWSYSSESQHQPPQHVADPTTHSDSAYYHTPSTYEDYPYSTLTPDVATSKEGESEGDVRQPYPSDYSEELASQMSKLEVAASGPPAPRTYTPTDSGEYTTSTTPGQSSSSSLAYNTSSVAMATIDEGSTPYTSSLYDAVTTSWYRSTAESKFSPTSMSLYDVSANLHHHDYDAISSVPSSSGMTVTSGSGYPVVPSACSVTEQQLRERVRQLEQVVKQKDMTIQEQRSQLKYSGPQKAYQDPSMISPGPATLYSSGSLPSPHHSGLIQHSYGTPPSISPQATMQHIQYLSHNPAAAAGTAFYTPQPPPPGYASHRWSGPLSAPLAGGQYPSPPGSLPAQQTITPPGTHLVLHHSGPILMPAAPAPTPPPTRPDLMSDQQLAAYLQVMEQGKAASAMPYAGGHTYHHHGYASLHPSSQPSYYARQYKHTY